MKQEEASETSTLQVVSRLIAEVIGDQYVLDQPITLATSFSRDLELESIEFVSLAEKLRDHYGDEVNFAAWLSNKGLEEIVQLKVGDLVEFIDRCRTGK